MSQLGSVVQQHWLSLIILVGVVVLVGMHLVWYIRPSDVESYAELQARLQRGQPTVVEFYSNL